MVYARAGGGTKNLVVPKLQRERFCLTDSEVLKLAGDAIGIEILGAPAVQCPWMLNGPKTGPTASSI